jgi:low affinity Fe/Cu permease
MFQCLDDYIVDSHSSFMVTTMIIVVYAIMVIIYAISYYFHDYSYGWIIMILKDHVIMVIKFCNIKLNNNHGRCI